MSARILQVFNRYLESGGEEASVERIFGLLSRQNDVQRYLFSSEAWRGPDAPPRWKQALLMIHNPRVAAELAERNRQSHPDYWLVHNVFPVGSATVYREALRYGVPIVQYIHNFRPFSVNGYMWAGSELATGGLRKNFVKEVLAGSWQDSLAKTACLAAVIRGMHATRLFRGVKAWIAISKFMRDRFVEAGVPAEDVFTVPHSWVAMPQAPAPEDGGYFLFLGRLIEAKGVKALFRTWDLIEAQLGANTPRLVIGGAGPLASWVATECQSRRYIEYVGHVSGERKKQLIGACRAMLAPSIWWEPLGLVTYEAYDSAKPMLAARSGGLSETVQHGETGFLHDAGDDHQLARQVVQLDADEALRLRMGRKGREWLLENTSEEKWLSGFNLASAHALSGK